MQRFSYFLVECDELWFLYEAVSVGISLSDELVNKLLIEWFVLSPKHINHKLFGFLAIQSPVRISIILFINLLNSVPQLFCNHQFFGLAWASWIRSLGFATPTHCYFQIYLYYPEKPQKRYSWAIQANHLFQPNPFQLSLFISLQLLDFFCNIIVL